MEASITMLTSYLRPLLCDRSQLNALLPCDSKIQSKGMKKPSPCKIAIEIPYLLMMHTSLRPIAV